jgi:hypothetical protein
MPMPEPPDPTPPRRASFAQIAGAVFWSFFGVRKGEAMKRDAVAIRPWQVIVVGIAFAALFVLTLIAIVRLIIAHASP